MRRRTDRTAKLAVALCGVAVTLTCLAAHAQAPTRVRGAIASFDGRLLSVTTGDGKVVAVQVFDKTEIVFTRPIDLADIKPGDFLGVTSTKQADGTLTASEVRRFPNPVNPGHRPFDGRSDQTMTNASVSAVVESASGRELTLAYEGGSQKVTVPPTAFISMLVPGDRAQLKPGATVNLTASGDGGGAPPTALRIQVSPVK